MKIVILHGGVPQGRRGVAPGAAAGAVIAVGCDGHWVFINASAAVAHRLDAGVPGIGGHGIDRSDVRTVLLCDAQLEHAAGLLGLRHGAPIDLYATPAVFEELAVALPVLPALQHYCGVKWRVVPVAGDQRRATFRVEGLPTLEFTALAVDGGGLPHAPAAPPATGDHLTITVHDLLSDRRGFFAPAPMRPDDEVLASMQRADCVVVDARRGHDGDATGWFDWIEGLPARHKLVHAAVDPRQQRALARRGIAVARDGMAFEL